MNTSFEEKSVWVQLGCLTAVMGVYFVVANRMLSEGVTQLMAFVPLIVTAVVLLVILMIVGHIVAAVVGRPEDRDERDRIIGWRSESNSSWVLVVGVLGAVMGMLLSVGNVWIANWLILLLFVSAIAKLVFQLVYYRRGMEG